MKVKVNHEQCIIEVWLSNADCADDAVCDSLLAQYRANGALNSSNLSKHKVAIFKSGKADLVDCTAALLSQNKALPKS